jgi:23S rRNA (adenine2503-C2)-methyltransferase
MQAFADDPRPHLFGMLPDELVAHLRADGVPCRDDEARRVLAEIVSHGRDAVRSRRPVAGRVLRAVDATTRRARLELLERVADPADGFVKYLFRSPDGALSEAVRIPLHKPGRYSVCLSSQVGCAMGCVFCATGRLGLRRNLRAWEIVAAFVAVRDELARDAGVPRGSRVSGAVFQGQGEPFHNYDELIQAARVLSHPCGGRISAESITISTVGLVPQIRRYTAEGHPYRLIVSLTSALPERRAALLPVAGRFDLAELADAIREHARSRKGLQTVAWVLMGGLNDGPDEVAALKQVLGDVPLRVNLVDLNASGSSPEGEATALPPLRRASDAERKAFLDALQVLHAPIVRRYSGGSGRAAACGMLAATRWAPGASQEN